MNSSSDHDSNKNAALKRENSLPASDASAPVFTSAPSTVALGPQRADSGVTEHDLAVAIRVLDAVASLDPKNAKKYKRQKVCNNVATSKDTEYNKDDDESANEQIETTDGLTLFRRPNLRQFRKSLASCLSLHQQLMYDGKSEKEFYVQRISERTLKRQKMAERAQQKKYVAATDLRRGRVEKLAKLKEDSKDEEEAKLLGYLVPDGHVNTLEQKAMLLENGDSNSTCVGDSDDGKLKDMDTTSIPDSNNDDDSNNNKIKQTNADEDGTVLPKLRSCYVCKVRFRILHQFYDQLCPACAALNYEKRHQTADMTNAVAVVTGSRVKIGFQVCLKLLRAGATVVATTRFPNNAVAAYRREKDFGEWSHRLHVYGLDLRDVTGLEAFTRYLKVMYGERGIDVLINNACQTVRRPGGYYLPLVEKEGELWTNGDEVHRNILSGCVDFERIRRRLVIEHYNPDEMKLSPEGTRSSKPERLLLSGDSNGHESSNENGDANHDVDIVNLNEASYREIVEKQTAPTSDGVTFETTGISHSAAMSQMAIVPEDVGIDEKVMPSGLVDINGQQLDLRTTNSWLLKMDQVSTPEIMECMFVNAIAPFVLNARLKPLMEAPIGDPNRPDRYIINVSAMEGKFYRYKMPNHPHTNMAKAALNMLTRTSSEDLARKSRIFMNSVDTGWINDENPLEKASKIARTNLFQTPIDEVDAAARILDPVFVGVSMDKRGSKQGKKTVKEFGKFFKDYRETEW